MSPSSQRKPSSDAPSLSLPRTFSGIVLCSDGHANEGCFDALTGTLTRPSFEERVLEELIHAEQFWLPVSLILVELQGLDVLRTAERAFERERILRFGADRLKRSIRKADILSRVDDHCFGVLGVGTDLHGASVVARRLVTQLVNPNSELVGQVDLRVAGAVMEGDAADMPGLFRAAEGCLARARQNLTIVVERIPDKSRTLGA